MGAEICRRKLLSEIAGCRYDEAGMASQAAVAHEREPEVGNLGASTSPMTGGSPSGATFKSPASVHQVPTLHPINSNPLQPDPFFAGVMGDSDGLTKKEHYNQLASLYPPRTKATAAGVAQHREGTEKDRKARKSEVLKRLPEDMQGEIVLRMTNLEYISPELIEQVDEVLKTGLATMGTMETTQLGGVEPMLARLGRAGVRGVVG